MAVYRWLPYALAGLAALCTPLLIALIAPAAHRWPLLGEGWSSGNPTGADIDSAVATALLAQALVQVAVFVVVFLATLPNRMRVALTPRRLRRAEAQRAALQQFLAHGLQRTTRRTGVLIFIAVAERQAVLLADQGINAKVSQEVWDGTVAALTKAAGEGRLADGLDQAIVACGAVLAQHFPAEGPALNELPNRVVEL